ncbi:MAG: elongation factor P [Chloroflexota bacterium]
MISTGDLKRGVTVDLEGELWTLLEYHHIKMGRGSAQVRMKLRNVRTGTTVERTFQAGEKFRRAILDKRDVTFLYREDGTYYFMDSETYEQLPMTAQQLGEAVNYLKENQPLSLLTYNDEAIGADLPPNVDLLVTQTDPGLRGDTANAGTKPATLETGLVVQVPLFIEEGERIRVDTRSSEYIERAQPS